MPISESMVQDIVQEVMAKMQIADAPVFRNYKYFFLSLCPERKRRAFKIDPPGKGSGL